MLIILKNHVEINTIKNNLIIIQIDIDIFKHVLYTEYSFKISLRFTDYFMANLSTYRRSLEMIYRKKLEIEFRILNLFNQVL